MRGREGRAQRSARQRRTSAAQCEAEKDEHSPMRGREGREQSSARQSRTSTAQCEAEREGRALSSARQRRTSMAHQSDNAATQLLSAVSNQKQNSCSGSSIRGAGPSAHSESGTPLTGHVDPESAQDRQVIVGSDEDEVRGSVATFSFRRKEDRPSLACDALTFAALVVRSGARSIQSAFSPKLHALWKCKQNRSRNTHAPTPTDPRIHLPPHRSMYSPIYLCIFRSPSRKQRAYFRAAELAPQHMSPHCGSTELAIPWKG